MSQIISLHIGGEGIEVGKRFWDILMKEHKIDHVTGKFIGTIDYPDNKHIDVYFGERYGKKIPRALFVVTETEPYISKYEEIYQPTCNSDNVVISSDIDCIFQKIMDMVDSNTGGDQFQGFQITHTLGDSLGDQIIQRVKENYPLTVVSCHTIYPASSISNIKIAESICNLIDYADLVFNYNLTPPSPPSPPSNESDYTIISKKIAVSTTWLRFPGELHCNLTKMLIELVPMTQCKFLDSSYLQYGNSTLSTLLEIYNLGNRYLEQFNKLFNINEFYPVLTCKTIILSRETNTITKNAVEAKIHNLLRLKGREIIMDFIPNNINVSFKTTDSEQILLIKNSFIPKFKILLDSDITNNESINRIRQVSECYAAVTKYVDPDAEA